MKVVIVGGGFGGLNAAKGLGRARVDVVLVDRRNHHLFQPMLYQVATAGLSPAHIAAPIRSVLASQKNTEVVLADVERVDAGKRVVVTDAGEIPYDVLVLATGATHSYFGKDAWAKAAPGLKTVEDALEIRRRFLLAFEAAEQEKDAAKRRALMTFVVIGAGPTGVETAGAIAEIARTVLRRDFRHIDTSQARVVLIEGQDRVLPAGFPAELSERAKRDLEAMGVEVRLRSMVTDVRGGESPGVTVGEAAGGERIDAHNIIWAAGVRGSPVGATIGAETDKAGRVIVGPDLSVPGHPEIFVIGDLAKVVGKDGQPVPGVCPAAVQMGDFVAGVIAREAAGQRGPRPEFRYRDKGSLATIGRSRAVAWLPVLGSRWKFAGFIAWALWAGVHVFFLIGFRSRVMVMIEWIWAYVFFSRGARLITESPESGRSSGARAG
ncbi:MAG: NAD(P)/FAD-dependent oxidoreductase [Tepidisphaera sp.]